MKLPKGWVFPIDFNLGLAPPAPRGAMAFAPAAHLVPYYTLGDVFRAIPRPCAPLLNTGYSLPGRGINTGLNPFVAPWASPLIPNPYTEN